ncbi:MAG TPA: YhfC family glutamic-type intramembrane protease [Stenomitos sp.]
MTNETIATPSFDWLDRIRTQLLLTSPLYLLVPVAFYALYAVWGIHPTWPAIGAGALGWFVALGLRAPVAVLAQKLAGSQEKAGNWIVAASGPLEETLRLLVLLWLGRDAATALAIGLGWAGIEVVFTLVNAFAANALLRRDDPKSVQAREMLAQNLKTDHGPLWGVIERITASALHIANTLIVAWMPLAAIATALVHSALNMGVVRLSKKSIVLAEALLALVASLSFWLGLHLFHLI